MSASVFGTIGVLMGGYSSERQISLRSGEGVTQALRQAGHKAVALDITADTPTKITEYILSAGIDIAFIALHGRLGEDGVIQGILEQLDIPYTGSGIKASQLAFNKISAQRAFVAAGLPVPGHYVITDSQYLDFKKAWEHFRTTPLVIKAACEGSSIGVHIVRHPAEWEPALRNALSFGPYVIIESFIKGREFTVGVFDQEPLPVVEICPKTSFFDFTAKYQKGATVYVCPANIPSKLIEQIQALALRAHEALGCQGFSRVDVRVDQQFQPYILEINTVPGFTETSLFPKAAKAAGYSFVGVCEKLLDLAYAKKIQR